MKEKILCVDDEPNILAAYRRQLRGAYEVDTAASGEEGLAKLAPKSSYVAIVSDLNMPGMNGIEFLAQARQRSANSIRVMLTGNAELHTAIEAVNEGNIFRFLTKPCSPEALLKTLEACVEQYRLVAAEHELLEKTLRGCMKILTEMLSLVSPLAFGRASRARRLGAKIAKLMELDKAWQIEIAAMLSQVGCMTIPNDVLKKNEAGQRLEPLEKKMFSDHPGIGANIVAIIPRLEEVAEIVRYQQKHYNGRGVPRDGLKERSIPIGARVLHVALDYDRLVCARGDSWEALLEIQGDFGKYDPQVVQTLSKIVSAEIEREPDSVILEELLPGMIFAEDVKSERGVIIISTGQEVTPSLKLRLENFARITEIQQPLKVLRPKD